MVSMKRVDVQPCTSHAIAMHVQPCLQAFLVEGACDLVADFRYARQPPRRVRNRNSREHVLGGPPFLLLLW